MCDYTHVIEHEAHRVCSTGQQIFWKHMKRSIPLWSMVSREERFFSAILFREIERNTEPMMRLLREDIGLPDSVTAIDVGFEVCLHRDLAHAKHIHDTHRPNLSMKQTIDLVLTLSNQHLVLVEVKAHERFTIGQLKLMKESGEFLIDYSELEIAGIYLAGIHSSKYDPRNVREEFPKLAMTTWKELAQAYPNASELSRADEIFDN